MTIGHGFDNPEKTKEIEAGTPDNQLTLTTLTTPGDRGVTTPDSTKVSYGTDLDAINAARSTADNMREIVAGNDPERGIKARDLLYSDYGEEIRLNQSQGSSSSIQTYYNEVIRSLQQNGTWNNPEFNKALSQDIANHSHDGQNLASVASNYAQDIASYIQQNDFTRAVNTLDYAIGASSMRYATTASNLNQFFAYFQADLNQYRIWERLAPALQRQD